MIMVLITAASTATGRTPPQTATPSAPSAVVNVGIGTNTNTIRTATVGAQPQYVLVNTAARSTPEETIKPVWDAFVSAAPGRPPTNPKLRFGVSTLISVLHGDADPQGLARIRGLLNVSQQLRVPVFLGIDGENWWEQSGLVNWWDTNGSGYAPSNRFNCEWSSPDGATNDASVLKISWRNWGSQIRVSPQQNIHSPAVMAATEIALTKVVRVIVEWYNQLPVPDRWLLAGIKVGWEACIGWNAYYYPDGNKYLQSQNASNDPHTGLNKSAPGAAWGVAQIGYAAAHSAGLTPSGPCGVLSRADIASLIQMYLGNVTQWVRDAGFPLDKLFTHVGGTMVDHTGDTPHVPFRAGMTGPSPLTSSTLGVSVYARPPAEQPTLLGDLNRVQPGTGARWASVEWGLGMYWTPPGVKHGSVEAWIAAYTKTLSFGDCRLLAYYNWNPGSPNVSLVAARKLIETWP